MIQSRILGVRPGHVLITALWLFAVDIAFASDEDAGVAAYVSSMTCQTCHEDIFANWKSSHHNWSLRVAEPSSVLGDFDNTTFEHFGAETRFFRNGEDFKVEITEGTEQPATYDILYTIGVDPLQQVIVEPAPGRLQVLNVAWDTTKQKWFHLQPERAVTPGDGLHWGGAYQNWNSRCADCHSTGFEKRFNSQTKHYDSRWAEANVACESCHGPGSIHVSLVQTDKNETGSGAVVKRSGFAFSASTATPSAGNEMCASCHARRESLTPKSHSVGKPFDDDFNLALLRDDLYFPDGQILDEVFVYGSFLQSKMNQSGVGCIDCHNPHSLALRAEGNALCAQCHTPKGNERFSSSAGLYDSKEHHRHEEGSEGSRCVSCHMPSRTYMVVDPRRDHSFRVPRPDLTLKTGSPNACTQCHQDLSDEDASAHVKAWFPNGQWRKPHFGESFHRQQNGKDGVATELGALVSNPANPEIIRASALDRLRQTSPEDAAALAPAFIGSDSALLRKSAVRALRPLSPVDQAGHLAPLLKDPSRSVRLEAANLLLEGASRFLAPEATPALRSVLAEYTAFLGTMSDMPETHMKIARLAHGSGNIEAGIAALDEALRLDNHLVEAWLALGGIYIAENRLADAENTFLQGLAHEPESINLLQHLGLLYSDLERFDEAVERLEFALELAPDNPQLRLNLSQTYSLGGFTAELEALGRTRAGH